MSSILSNIVIKLGFQANITSGSLSGTVEHNPTDSRPSIGTETGRSNIVFSNSYSVASGAPRDLDLSALTDPAGNAISFLTLQYHCVENTSAGTNTITVGGGSNPLFSASYPLPIRAGDWWAHEGVGHGVGISGTNRVMRITSSGGTQTCKVTFLGRTTLP